MDGVSRNVVLAVFVPSTQVLATMSFPSPYDFKSPGIAKKSRPGSAGFLRIRVC